ncbi:MAG TPA: M42 family peptidase [Solirubrobacterales bacterium]|nr:M42 family peptidase [Solirubrobacterales bacterium]
MTETALPPLLDELLHACAPSGFEGPAAEVWRRAAGSFAEVGGDAIGSSTARVGEGSPTLAVVGHIDEIGLIVTNVDDEGFIWFGPLGYWDPQVLVGQRVRVLGPGGPVRGVISRKPLHHLLGRDELHVGVRLESLHIDIGAADAEEARGAVRTGSPIVIEADPEPVFGSRFVSRCGDDRLGAYVALESLRRCAEGDGPGGSFVAVASVQEELGLRGANTTAFEVRPDVAIAVDVTQATDYPGVEEERKRFGHRPLGSGPAIAVAPTVSNRVSELLIETAEAEGIPYTTRGTGLHNLGLSTETDADAMQVSRAGIATGVVSIPLRYMHTPVEMFDLRDVEGAVALLAAFGSRLDSSVEISG